MSDGSESKQRPALAISACLAGVPCSYSGKAKPVEHLDELRERYRLIYVCPETLGGLPTPRVPSEIQGDRVVMKDGTDVTEAFEKGAKAALEKARCSGCGKALLKEKSPSCGFGAVYDGTFSGTLVEGNGLAAALFSKAGIEVYGESRVGELLPE